MYTYRRGEREGKHSKIVNIFLSNKFINNLFCIFSGIFLLCVCVLYIHHSFALSKNESEIQEMFLNIINFYLFFKK